MQGDEVDRKQSLSDSRPRRRRRRHGQADGNDADLAVVRPLALDAEIDAAVEARLSGLVLAAQTGSYAARNEIHALLLVKIRRWVEREWLMIRDRTATVEVGDVHGEAFLVLADLIEQWPGAGGFGAYVMRVFPWRLRAAVRQQAGLPVRLRQTSRTGGWLATVDLAVDPGETQISGLLAEQSWLAEQAISLLETLSADLDEPDRLLLVWRVRDGQTMTEIARRLGLSRRQLHRRWDRITEWIRTEWAA